ncbi:PAP2 domain-containing protein [Pochonia chlamydosporia 170]|uniref:PAP2 domain-containing protein n=1 Tax=Pochonia chlamydosporia 170 TaxID=1380566 RepID=A0A179F6F1_METCM|nr:PAP2 domain-containing protein [Pochonia chlamydosporia 170]OAQ61024.1 PAP2 domain-containing protein [Pochonia chlamydosporia 170]
MASDQLSVGLDYLTDAAHILRQTAPETSAHLMLQRNELMFHNHLAQHEVQRQYVCGACGHIMIPGDNTALVLEARQPLNLRKRTASTKGKEQPKSAASGSKGPTKTITCGHCSRVTNISLPAPEAVTHRRTTRASAIKKTLPVESQNQKTTANASSKKRAKNRKGGLQALLSGQQQKSTNSLSLADFMR